MKFLKRAATISNLPWAALFLLLAARAVLDAQLLFKYPVAIGYDGYYYVLQSVTLLNQGHFYFPTNTPFIFYVISVVNYLSGDVIFAIKIIAILLHQLLSLGVSALIITSTRSIWLGVLGAALTSLSNLHFYFESEFIKSLCACSLLLWSSWALIQYIKKSRAAWLYCSSFLALLAIFSHKLGIFLISFAALALLALRLLFSPRQNRQKRFVGISILCCIEMGPILIALLKQVGVLIPHAEDSSLYPHIPLDFLTYPECLVLLVIGPLTLFLLFHLRKQIETPVIYLYGVISLIGVLLILNPFLNTEKAMLSATARIRMLSYIAVAVLIPGTFYLLSKFSKTIPLYFSTFIITLLIVLNISTNLPKGMQDDFLLERTALQRNLPLYRGKLGENPIVIAMHGNEFLVTWAMHIPAQQKVPSNKSYQSTFWLLCRASSLAKSGIVVSTEGSNAPFVLIEDNQLHQQMQYLTAHERGQLFGYNRHLLDALELFNVIK